MTHTLFITPLSFLSHTHHNRGDKAANCNKLQIPSLRKYNTYDLIIIIIIIIKPTR
jgi:hypothetical protein